MLWSEAHKSRTDHEESVYFANLTFKTKMSTTAVFRATATSSLINWSQRSRLMRAGLTSSAVRFQALQMAGVFTITNSADSVVCTLKWAVNSPAVVVVMRPAGFQTHSITQRSLSETVATAHRNMKKPRAVQLPTSNRRRWAGARRAKSLSRRLQASRSKKKSSNRFRCNPRMTSIRSRTHRSVGFLRIQRSEIAQPKDSARSTSSQ